MSSTDYQIQIKGVAVTNSNILLELAFPKSNPVHNLLNFKLAYDVQTVGNAATFCDGYLVFNTFQIIPGNKTSRNPKIVLPLRPAVSGKYGQSNVQVNLTISAPGIRFVPSRKSLSVSANFDGSIRYSNVIKGSAAISIQEQSTAEVS